MLTLRFTGKYQQNKVVLTSSFPFFACRFLNVWLQTGVANPVIVLKKYGEIFTAGSNGLKRLPILNRKLFIIITKLCN